MYASSAAHLEAWRAELRVPAPPVRPLPIPEIVPGVVVEGPVAELAEQVRELYRRFRNRSP